MTAETATRRPWTVTLAVVLVMLGTLVAATTAAGPQGAATLVLLLVAVCFWFAVRAGRGRRGARTAVTGLTAAVLVVAAPFALDDPLYGGTTLLLAALLAVPGVVLLYLPAAEAYVRARSGDGGEEFAG
ncbi:MULTISPECIES: hypothetical protein [Streptomyces]|uniref:Uncharacterized protein n=1 Tax=Streptomyces tendae TaxID=1932 RepID=A0A6B3QST5_STRTE|nr:MULTISPECIES: hypothetical protein [Streptomyces]BET46788.1 hypothetical protein RGQ21_17700 [Kitasatospora aureofaciens]MBQ0967276.1 hypothetical protein [Streptomyces sp. RK74B]MBQ1007820.1 hypothetical protein [Streptomyces sp. RK23]MCW1097322.1 hypothetical protein [Streptomyces sp. RS2]MZG18665.1 hypothetical protein [Streptomyces sp. SID5914]